MNPYTLIDYTLLLVALKFGTDTELGIDDDVLISNSSMLSLN